MSSIAINQTVSAAVLKMMTSNTEDIVGKLAEKYGFDREEALALTLPYWEVVNSYRDILNISCIFSIYLTYS